ncbi:MULTISPECIES: Rab family GTPase [Roseivirga]|jgi:small GTP-binding protein|uniref:GTP-binding protein n=1 Tax=Roseivirga thermotolerans TaxID=1758176 RepID=A0ABQ3I1K5_9BACT|nr:MULTISPECIES: Rab family GTPase [Roseivirga]GHE55569.1 GTP-binding protein [Roseivirga thermotolerans]|tara:strand:+ start:97326 stop:97808 length:483 start_codon:yes stop_codon:yes gene_type:complete
MNKKVILVGHFGVGKTSLVRRFVHSQFSEEYITTIGVKIDKKTVTLNGRMVTLLIWDIAGEDAQHKVPQSYRLGAHGVLYVIDVSRPSSYQDLITELTAIQELLPGVPVEILANKRDLVSEEEWQHVQEQILPFKAIATSAKTGEYVEEAFIRLTERMVV